MNLFSFFPIFFLRWPLTIFFKNSFNSILRSDIRCKHNQRKYCRRVHMWGTRLWILCRCGERLSTFSRVLSSPISWWKGGNAKMEFYLSKPNHLWPGKPLHLIKGLDIKFKKKYFCDNNFPNKKVYQKNMWHKHWDGRQNSKIYVRNMNKEKFFVLCLTFAEDRQPALM